VVIARQQAEDRIIFATILVDFFCLGVKNAFCNADFSRRRFENNLARMCSGAPEPCDVGLAHELIYGSLEFARRYGFEPHPDFKLCSQVLDPPEAHPPKHNLEFGKDGKPLFVSGPYDDVDAILARLRKTAGDDNFDYLSTLVEPEDF
jgi:hypothetical protein